MERKITALEVQKHNPQRVNIYLEGEFAFGLSRITAAWLQVGQVLDEEKIRELQAADQVELTYQKALNFLSYRSRSVLEMTQNLRSKNYSDQAIQDAIDRLKSSGLLDDFSFAQTWVENRSEFRPRGCRVLRMELRQKGIPKEIIESVLGEVNEEVLAYKAALKQAKKYRGLPGEEFRRKMIAFLARRGFDFQTAAEAVEKVRMETAPSEIDPLFD